jgi:hydroxymethylglutaryl-CoA reductase
MAGGQSCGQRQASQHAHMRTRARARLVRPHATTHNEPIRWRRYTHALIGNPDARTLAELLVCVGLAQNFSALRALALEGIQRGHMTLHASNIAASVGAPEGMVAEIVQYMVSCGRIDAQTARSYIQAHCSSS